MSNKMTCLGCNSHTSDVLRAFEEGERCPYCSLSAEATLEIQTVRRSRADEEIKGKCEQALRDRDQARTDLKRANARLAYMESLISDAADRLTKPLSEEEISLERQW